MTCTNYPRGLSHSHPAQNMQPQRPLDPQPVDDVLRNVVPPVETPGDRLHMTDRCERGQHLIAKSAMATCERGRMPLVN